MKEEQQAIDKIFGIIAAIAKRKDLSHEEKDETIQGLLDTAQRLEALRGSSHPARGEQETR